MRAWMVLPFIGLFNLSSTFACSNVFITGNHCAVVGRTMDFPFNTGGVVGYGLKGDKNVSFLNMEAPSLQPKATVWVNQHNYLGETFLDSNVVIDGINDAGVYAGFLYLPDFTEYPVYNSHDKRTLLSATDTINYILGSASSVDEALKLIRQQQIVMSGAETKVDGKSGIYIATPCHLTIRDRTGHSAVIEWVKGKTVIYDHAGPVLTNSPTYDWQVKNAQRYDYVTSFNIDAKYEGSYMNGTGFTGMPGDFSPPSRFARATQLIKHMPAPQNDQTAVRMALTALESIQVPIGASDSPSLWKTVIDLNKGTYYFYPMYSLVPEYAVLGQKGVQIRSPDLMQSWQKYSVADLATPAKLPSSMTHVSLSLPKPGYLKKVISVVNMPTQGPGQHYHLPQ